MARVTHSSLTNIRYCTINQGSGATPGTIVIESAIPEDPDSMDRESTLTVTDTQYYGTWKLHLAKNPRTRQGIMRSVWKDERVLLEDYKVDKAWNFRDGQAAPKEFEKATAKDMLEYIADGAGVSISVDSFPDFIAGGAYAGWSGIHAVSNILKTYGMRLVYDPTSEEFKANIVTDSGSPPSTRGALVRPAPNSAWKEVKAFTDTPINEKEVSCTAKKVADNGQLQTVTSYLAENRSEQNAETRFQLWEYSGLPDKAVVVPTRGKAAMFGTKDFRHVRAVWKPDQLDIWPPNEEVEWYPTHDKRELSDFGHGGQLFVTKQPIIQRSGNQLATSTTFIMSYLDSWNSPGVEKTETINADGQGTLNIDCRDWARPIYSDLDDMPSAADTQAGWEELMGQIAEQSVLKYSGEPKVIHYPSPRDLQDGGEINPFIGGHYFEFRATGSRGNVSHSIAVSFDPSPKSGSFFL